MVRHVAPVHFGTADRSAGCTPGDVLPVGCHSLGLGLTTAACYICLAILVAPALDQMGANKIAVHMFNFYWGMASSPTSPVALASFAAAGIGGAPQSHQTNDPIAFRRRLAAGDHDRIEPDRALLNRAEADNSP